MAKLGKRMYMSIDDVQNEYLPISKKKIRQYIKPLPHGKIGGRLFIRRDVLEAWLRSVYKELHADRETGC